MLDIESSSLHDEKPSTDPRAGTSQPAESTRGRSDGNYPIRRNCPVGIVPVCGPKGKPSRLWLDS